MSIFLAEFDSEKTDGMMDIEVSLIRSHGKKSKIDWLYLFFHLFSITCNNTKEFIIGCESLMNVYSYAKTTEEMMRKEI